MKIKTKDQRADENNEYLVTVKDKKVLLGLGIATLTLAFTLRWYYNELQNDSAQLITGTDGDGSANAASADQVKKSSGLVESILENW